ncbi:metalloprotease TldD [Candidatus Pantoea carbekii]|uniref:TldD protein n=1 Tax=Candidatus Pantoea carbekii TaxID=1235990 RepID=U3U2A0_9GAMM|nr:metalloprotease TldD [Candidatus Pantoea carbekii]AKC32509.1 protein TldD [Candidatus Pantoea carbekii]BAO00236.1 TldD protein [Candidatus Pantoea carbekii]
MTLSLVHEQLLTVNNINNHNLSCSLEKLAERRIDYGDLYFQSSLHESWVLEDKIIKDGSYHLDQGIGVRAISGEKTGFAYSDQISMHALQESVDAARSIVNEQGDSKICVSLENVLKNSLYASINPLDSLQCEDKIALLYRIDKVARSIDPCVKEVYVNLSGVYEQVLIASTDGTLATDVRPLVRLSINVQVEYGNKRESGSSGSGARTGYEFFLNDENGDVRADVLAHEAVRIALINLSAISAPAGLFPVVLGAGWPGILLHEAVGHGLEGDFNRRATSVFSGNIGKLVASELCTIVDDGTIKGLCGSVAVDDEGVPGQYNVLIENGILKGYMHDKLNAYLMTMKPTGNGRRESYAHLPMPRMTNTYMLAGKSTPQEIIESVDYGLYATNFAGGQVDITSGKFVFSTSEAYLIEKGKVTKPVKHAMLIGSGIEVMQNISMLGNDLVFDKGIGICGKEGQSVPVSVGQPTLKLDKLTIGGTN